MAGGYFVLHCVVMRPDFPFRPTAFPFYYGWIVLAVSTIGLVMSAPGQTIGVSVFTENLIKGFSRQGKSFIYLDTSDRRPPDNIGKWELGNILLGLKHCAKLFKVCLLHKPETVYLPISQNRPAFLRDALFCFVALGFRRRLLLHVHGASLGRFLADTDPFTRWLARGCSGSGWYSRFCPAVDLRDLRGL